MANKAIFKAPSASPGVKTMITITMDILSRIRNLGKEKEMTSDARVITYLLQFYEDAVTNKLECVKCHGFLEIFCPKCDGTVADTSLGASPAMHVKQEVCSTESEDHGDSYNIPQDVNDSDSEPFAASAASSIGDDFEHLPVSFGASDKQSSATRDAGVGANTLTSASTVNTAVKSARISIGSEKDLDPETGVLVKRHKSNPVGSGRGPGRPATSAKKKAATSRRKTLPTKIETKPKPLIRVTKPSATGSGEGSESEELTTIVTTLQNALQEAGETDGQPARHVIRRKERRKKEYQESRGTPYKCAFCGQSFSLWKTFQEHLYENLDARYSYRCRHCNEVLRNFRDMKRHGRGHLTEMRHKCEYCGETFPMKVNMRPHYLAHKKEGVLLCSICGKSFWILKNLQQHMRIHTGEKAFQCNWCGKCFTQKQQLIRHVRTHTGEKPYKCSHCPAAFSQSDSLNRHLQKHSQENRGFTCPECGANFSDKPMLTRHRRLIHGLSQSDIKNMKQQYSVSRPSFEQPSL